MKSKLQKIQSWLYFPLFFCLFFMLWEIICSTVSQNQTLPSEFANKNILLVIAHPDDEAMFFTPTILGLLNSKNTINSFSVVSLSNGNAEGLGSIRKNELIKSCNLLGIPASNVKLIDDPLLQDSITTKWDSSAILSVIEDDLLKADTIITFDKHGVSGHPNHISIYEALSKAFKLENPTIKGKSLWCLTTVSIFRKYLSAFDATLTIINRILFNFFNSNSSNNKFKSLIFFSNYEKNSLAKNCMINAHVSQMVWYRWLWIYLSRYMVINDIVPLYVSE